MSKLGDLLLKAGSQQTVGSRGAGLVSGPSPRAPGQAHVTVVTHALSTLSKEHLRLLAGKLGVSQVLRPDDSKQKYLTSFEKLAQAGTLMIGDIMKLTGASNMQSSQPPQEEADEIIDEDLLELEDEPAPSLPKAPATSKPASRKAQGAQAGLKLPKALLEGHLVAAPAFDAGVHYTSDDEVSVDLSDSSEEDEHGEEDDGDIVTEAELNEDGVVEAGQKAGAGAGVGPVSTAIGSGRGQERSGAGPTVAPPTAAPVSAKVLLAAKAKLVVMPKPAKGSTAVKPVSQARAKARAREDDDEYNPRLGHGGIGTCTYGAGQARKAKAKRPAGGSQSQGRQQGSSITDASQGASQRSNSHGIDDDIASSGDEAGAGQPAAKKRRAAGPSSGTQTQSSSMAQSSIITSLLAPYVTRCDMSAQTTPTLWGTGTGSMGMGMGRRAVSSRDMGTSMTPPQAMGAVARSSGLSSSSRAAGGPAGPRRGDNSQDAGQPQEAEAGGKATVTDDNDDDNDAPTGKDTDTLPPPSDEEDEDGDGYPGGVESPVLGSKWHGPAMHGDVDGDHGEDGEDGGLYDEDNEDV